MIKIIPVVCALSLFSIEAYAGSPTNANQLQQGRRRILNGVQVFLLPRVELGAAQQFQGAQRAV